MKCGLCGRDNLSQKEFELHTKFFHKKPTVSSKDNCPDCGAALIMQEGCQHCTCGYSKCA